MTEQATDNIELEGEEICAPVVENEALGASEECAQNDTERQSAHNVQEENDAPPDNSAQNPPPLDPDKHALENALAELEAERALRKRTEVKLACISMLEKCSLPISLCDYLTGDSIEETQKRVDEVSKIVKVAIGEGVKSRLATIPTPTECSCAMTRAEFKSLSLADLQRLYVTDKALYKELSNKI